MKWNFLAKILISIFYSYTVLKNRRIIILITLFAESTYPKRNAVHCILHLQARTSSENNSDSSRDVYSGAVKANYETFCIFPINLDRFSSTDF